MERNNSKASIFSDYLKNKPFREVLPWIGGDLQTLRDTFVIDFDKSKKNKKILFPINKILSKKFECDYLLGFLELPEKLSSLRGFVIVTHGLGGSTKRFGLRRISRKLANNGFGVLKLNLRGSGSARYLAKGNYCARCSSDVISVIKYLKKLPSMLLIHSKDDPWVPYNDTLNLRKKLIDKFTILITEKGGHNGFHSINGCWSDEAVKNWLKNF